MKSLVILLGMSACVLAQSPQCQVAAVPPLLRAEGVAERVGDIVLTCTGSPNQTIAGNLTVFLDVPITNKVLSGNSLNVALTVNNQPSPTPAQLQTPGSLVFSGLQFQIAANGSSELRISNIRANASLATASDITAQLAFNPPGLLSFPTNRLTVGALNRGLLATTLQSFVPSQIGSALPESSSFTDLVAAGTRFSTTRVTEGFVSAFEPRAAGADNGVRVVLRLSGYPSDARLFAQNAIAGSNASKPTAAGDFGGVVSPGEYVAGSRSLYLVRVIGADANGAGGSLIATFNATPNQMLNEVTEVPLAGGSGTLVYEVVDSNPAAVETAQVPVFIGLPRTAEARTLTTNRTVSLGPVSIEPGVSALAPVPRFTGANAPSDCTALRDCSGPFLPKLEVITPPLNFETIQGAAFFLRYILLQNNGGGILPYNARVDYKDATGWLRIFPASGSNGGTIRLDVIPAGLAIGTYEATLTIDAGQAGSATLPIRLRVSALPPPVVTITSAVNAASFGGSLVSGSLGTVRGTSFSGANLALTVNGQTARILFANNEQINFQVPAGLTGPTVQVVATVNGVTSTPLIAPLAPVSPGVFVPGILNQDNSVNNSTNPAKLGSIVQIFGTGLLAADGSGSVDVRIHDVTYAAGSPGISYAGPAPGIPGVQQINVRVPETLGTGTTDVEICSSALGQRVCGPTVRIGVTQ